MTFTDSQLCKHVPYQSKEFVGKEFVGKEFVGKEFVGKEFVGKEFVGKEFVGKEFVGKEFVGKEFVGKEFVGKEFVGKEFVGKEFVGKEFVGKEFVGKAHLFAALVWCKRSDTLCAAGKKDYGHARHLKRGVVDRDPNKIRPLVERVTSTSKSLDERGAQNVARRCCQEIADCFVDGDFH